MKKVFYVLLSVLCAFSLCACDGMIDVNFSTDVDISLLEQSDLAGTVSEASETGDEDKVIGLTSDDVVVFLGDSIAEGYGLNDVENERYSALIQNAAGCPVYNYAVSGDDGNDLIQLLESGSCTELENATVIVISIGANNVLKAADTLIPYLEYLQNGGTPADTLDISETFNVIVQGVERFKTELPEIISDIRTVNEDAAIVFQTVYNPYRDFTEFKVEQNGMQVSFSAFSASCVIAINDVICDNAETLGYVICDIYKPFKEYEGNLINALADGSNVDPHPNAEGHRLIAELVMSAIEEGQIP